VTDADLIRALRLEWISHRKNDELLAPGRIRNADRRAEFLSAQRRSSASRRALTKEDFFANLTAAYSAAYGTEIKQAAEDLDHLISFVRCFHMLLSDNFSPQQLRELVKEQNESPAKIAAECRAIAEKLNPEFNGHLCSLATEIEARGTFALASVEIGAGVTFNLANNIGRRGGAAKVTGAWRALFIRETAQRLPKTIEKHRPYATIAALLTWAKIPNVTPQLVRSTLAKGHT
jgi:hypothetical protein